jgi:FecR protein
MKAWLLIPTIVLLSISEICYSAIGSVTEQFNTPPSIQRKAQTLTGAKGTGVEMNDTVRTVQGKVGITFEDNTKVQVNENSKLVIDDFVYDPKKGTGKLALNMAMGTVRYASGQIAKNSPQSVGINTPSATVSVRGTDFTATVDELGRSTFILLPSCPSDRNTRTLSDIESSCRIGEIIVESDAGQVILNQAFQATRVDSRSAPPSSPVILKLSEGAINNMLIVSPPKEMNQQSEKTSVKLEMKNSLDMDFLKEQGLANALDEQQKEMYQDKLARNFLDQNFLANILDILDSMMKAQLNLLNTTSNKLLPDYNALTGIIVDIQEPKITLSRDDGSNVMSVTTPTTQNTTLYFTQGAMDTIKNRINSGGSTVITLIQR